MNTLHTLNEYLQTNEYALPFLVRNDLCVTVTETDSSNAYTSVKDTVDCMRQIIRESSQSPIVLRTAHALYRDTMGGFIVSKLQSIFSYIRGHVRFVPDESVVNEGSKGRELLIRPEVLLTMPNPQGDCDDFTLLAGGLMMGMGIVPKIVTIAANPINPQNFSHVFVRVYYWDAGKQEMCKVDFDCSHGLHLNWKAEKYYRIQEWDI